MSGSVRQLQCPIPIAADAERVTLAHGEGARAMRQLIAERVLPRFENEFLASLDDAARLPPLDGPPVVTTDSFVVSPLFFPGGDIGRLAVFGTVNDLAVVGARPRWLTLSLILEEGLPLPVLEAVLTSAAESAREAGVHVVAGDTKVVPKGAADGLFVNTAGLGELVEPAPCGPASVQTGDVLIVTGPIGRHGIAVVAARDDLGFEPSPESDCGCLIPAADALRTAGIPVRAMRDATRGGVAAVLHEWASACGHTLAVEETNVPVSADVRGVCELLGLDPLHVANEGTMVVAVGEEFAAPAIEALRRLDRHREAGVVGRVEQRGSVPVVVRTALGGERALDEPQGSLLPRIC